MRSLALVLVVVLAVVTAGCLTSPLESASADGHATGAAEASALTHWDAALALGAGWNASADLVQVTASEGPALRGHVDPPIAWETATDPDAGNGLAIVWTFVFANPDDPGTRFYASFAGDGTVLYANHLPAPYYYHTASYAEPTAEDSTVVYPDGTTEPAVARPGVDSDAAMVAANTFDVFDVFADDHPRHQVTLGLVQTPDGPAWALHKSTATYFGAGVMVDATDGTVLRTWSHPTPIIIDPVPPCDDCCHDCWEPEPRPENATSTHSGTIAGPNPLDPYTDQAAVFTFDVDSSYWFRDATVAVTADTMPGQSISVRVIGPDGWDMGWGWGESAATATVRDWAPEGTYTVEVWVEGMHVQDVAYDADVEVRYDEPGRRDIRDEWHSVSQWNGPLAMEMPVDHDADHLAFDLTSTTRGPTDGLHVRVTGPDGIVFEDDLDAEDHHFEVTDPAAGSWSITVWATPTSVFPVDVHLVGEVEYGPWGEATLMDH